MRFAFFCVIALAVTIARPAELKGSGKEFAADPRGRLIGLGVPGGSSLTLTGSVSASISSSGVNPRGSGTILAGLRRIDILDRGLLRFDVSAMPAGAVVQSVRLHLRVVMVPGTPVPSMFSLHRMLVPWSDTEATWERASNSLLWQGPGGTAGKDFAAESSASTQVAGLGAYVFESPDLAADVQAWAANPAGNAGWLLKTESESTASTARHFGSGESSQPPRLEIVYSTGVSAPEIKDVRLVGTNLTFRVEGAVGSAYRGEYRDEVDRGTWATFTNVTLTATNSVIVSVPVIGPRRFYRVAME